MVNSWVYFLGGALSGFFAGMALVCFLVAAKRADQRADRELIARGVAEWDNYVKAAKRAGGEK